MLEYLGPLAGLQRLSRLELAGCERLADLDLVPGLRQLTTLVLRDCKRLRDLNKLSEMPQLISLDLGGCERLKNLDFLKILTSLKELSLRGHKYAFDLALLAVLVNLTRLDLGECQGFSDLSPLANLTQLTSLRLGVVDSTAGLEPLSRLEKLTKLEFEKFVHLIDLSPLVALRRLTSLSLGVCDKVTDLGPLAELAQLKELMVCSDELTNLRPLVSLSALESLELSQCPMLADITPLSYLDRLKTLSLFGNERLSLVAGLSHLQHLTDLDLYMCPNIRDIEALAILTTLRILQIDETATQDSILLASATRRGDFDLPAHAAASAASFALSKNPELHAQRLVAAVEALVVGEADPSDLLHAVTKAFRARGEVPSKTWEALFTAIKRAPDPAFRPAFEAALLDLPLADAARVLAPALLALTDAPPTSRPWALSLVQQSLLPVAASASHAREVAPAAAVFFHAQCMPGEVDAWLERGSVAQVPAWRDRVLLALLARALRTGQVLEARRLLALLQTAGHRDQGRALLAQHLGGLSQFSAAAAELDQIVDRANKASAAAQALAFTPAFAGDVKAGLSLLLALDGEPDALADVLATMIGQAPDSDLVKHLAVVFAPTSGVDLAQGVDALLGHGAVAGAVKPKLLASLRGRLRSDRRLAQTALTRGAVALLQAEGLVDDDEAAEVTAALLESAS